MQIGYKMHVLFILSVFGLFLLLIHEVKSVNRRICVVSCILLFANETTWF